MYDFPCAVTIATNKYHRNQQSGEELWEQSEIDLYNSIEPIIEELKLALQHHVRYNEAGMDHKDTRDFIIETVGELL